MEKEFGLSTADLEARMFALEPVPGEEVYRFILRVENARRGVHGGDAATLHCYLPRLPHWFQGEVEQVRRTKRTTSAGPLTWADVVDLARDVQLRPTRGAAGSAGTGGYPVLGGASGAPAAPAVAPAAVPAPAAPAPVHVAAPVPRAAAAAAPAKVAAAPAKRKCDYCTPLNIGMDGHDRKWCYVDPNSQAYKADVRARRIKQAKAKGVNLPAYLQEESPGAVGLVAGV